jgi:hypothetical protein
MSSDHADTVSLDSRVKYVEANVEWELSSVFATDVDPKTCDPTLGNCAPVVDNRLWHLDRIDSNTPVPSPCDRAEAGCQRALRRDRRIPAVPRNGPRSLLASGIAGGGGRLYGADDKNQCSSHGCAIGCGQCDVRESACSKRRDQARAPGELASGTAIARMSGPAAAPAGWRYSPPVASGAPCRPLRVLASQENILS